MAEAVPRQEKMNQRMGPEGCLYRHPEARHTRNNSRYGCLRNRYPTGVTNITLLSNHCNNVLIYNVKVLCNFLIYPIVLGTIDGVILHRFYKDHSKYFTTGSVVVLKQFGILNSNEGHCITITSKNVLVIYHIRDPNKKDADNTEIKEPFEKVVLQHYNIEDIWKEANSNIAKVSKNDKNLLKNINNTPYGKNKSISNFNNTSRGINISPQNNTPLSNLRLNNQQSSCSNFLLPKINHISAYNQNVNNLPENFNLEKGIVQHESKKKFDFKKVAIDISTPKPIDAENVVISCSEMSVTADKKDSEIWKSVLEDVDSESLFGDF